MPNHRLGITLPEGTQVKANKVVGGSPGYGEIRTEERSLQERSDPS